MSDHKPRVSIGLPVYNGENFLKEALDSILNQTFEDFELIISDNASTDRTEEICREYLAKDSRIRYYRNSQNLGAAGNYNRVFDLSRGEYFKWAAHDDVCAPEYLECCVEVLEQNPSVVLCYPKTVIINERGQREEQDYSDDLNLRSPKPRERFKGIHNAFFYVPAAWRQDKISPIFGLIRRDVLQATPRIGGYEGSDLVLLGELALRGEFYEVPQYLFYRRKHQQRAMHAYRTNSERAAWFDAAKKGKIVVPRWRLFWEFIASINRVKISLSEKFYAYLQMMIWLLTWGGARIIKELILATAQYLNITSEDFFKRKESLQKTKT